MGLNVCATPQGTFARAGYLHHSQGPQVKYELDKASGALFIDRFLFTPTTYPVAYGFVPNTLADDGDPVDALVLTPGLVVPGCVIRARPIGMLLMEDEAGEDAKVICVPQDRVHPQYTAVTTVNDLPPIIRASIEHFFESYKDLEDHKWVKIKGWTGKAEAEQVIRDGVEAYRPTRS